MKKSNLIVIITMSLFFFGMFTWTIFAETPNYSDSERRVLADFPDVSVEAILEGDFADDFDKYAAERFPARDMWRSIKAYASKALFQKDNNGIYTTGEHISKVENPVNSQMQEYAVSVIEKVNNKYLSSNDVYLAIIPDKNYYLAEASGHLSLDYDELTNNMISKLSFAKYIEIADLLDSNDYYYTDSHWRQERIVDVANRITNKMGTSVIGDFEEKVATTSFEGVYLGQSALRWQPDTIKYLTNDVIENAEVTLNDTDSIKPVYDLQKLQGKDPYEVFLSGNQPVVSIKNDTNSSGKRLVIFRDSFGSSLAPLLIDAYSEIVLIDLRYIPSDLIGDYVDFRGADILFIYSTSLLNNSLTLK